MKSKQHILLQFFVDHTRALSIVAVCAILLGAFLIRFIGVADHSMWGDEPQVYVAAESILETGIPYFHSGYLYLRDLPHLYTAAATAWLFGNGEFSIRIISVVAGVLVVLLGYLLTRRMATERAALVVAIILSLHPWLVSFSRIGRSYIAMTALLMATVYFAMRYSESEWKFRYGAFTAVFGVLSVLTHQTGQTAILLCIPLLVILAYHRRIDGVKGASVRLIQVMWPFVIIAMGIVVGKLFASKTYYNYSDQFIELLHDFTIVEQIMAFVPLTIQPHLEYLFYIQPSIPVLFAFSILFIVMGLLRFAYLKEQQQFFLVTLISFFAILVFSEKAVNINRAVLYTAPFIIIGAVLIIDDVLERMGSYKTVLAVGIFGFLAAMQVVQMWPILQNTYGTPLAPEHSFFEGWNYRLDLKTTFEYVAERYEEGDTIIVMGNPKFAAAYFPDDLVPDYYVSTNNPTTVNGGYHYVVESKLIDNLSELQRTTKENNAWIITTYSIGNLKRINHLSGGMRKWIQNQESFKLYQSADPWARVYYFPFTD